MAESNELLDTGTDILETVSGDGSSSNVIISYGETPTQTFAELTQLAAKGLLYARMMTTVLQASAWGSKTIEFSTAYGHYASSWIYDVNSGWSSSVEDTAKVSVETGSTPGYLGDVLKAGKNITITKDGAYVRIDSSMPLSFVASKDSDFVTGFYLVNTNVADKQLSVQVSSQTEGADAFDGYWQYTCELDYCLITVKLPDTYTWRVCGKYDRVSGGILVTLHKGQTVVLHQYYDTLSINIGNDVSSLATLANSSNDVANTSFDVIASNATKKGEIIDDKTVGTSFNITGSTFESKETV